MRRLGVRLALVVAVSLLAAAVALAHVKHYPSTLTTTGVAAGPPETFFEFGQVQTPKAACRAGRKMKIIALLQDNSLKVLDTDRSSKNGAYAFLIDVTNVKKATIEAARKKLGKRGVCDPASVIAD